MQKTDLLWTSLKQTFPAPGEQPHNIERDFGEEISNDTVQRQVPIPRVSNDFIIPALTIDANLRAQLRQRALELFAGGRCSSSSYLALYLLPTAGTSTSDTSTLAIDALCFGALGAHFSEPNPSQAATARYYQASKALLRRINMMMGKSMLPKEVEDLLITTIVLADCTYLESCRSAAGDLQRYCSLLVNLVRRCGLPPTSLMTQRCWLERLFYAGLVAGKSITSSLVKSQSTTSETSFFDSYALTAIELREDVKAISDANLRDERTRNEILKQLHKLGQLIASVKRLHLQWSSETPFRFHVASIKTFQDFHLFHPHASEAFALAYRFRNPHDESEFQASTLCSLEISQATINIYDAHPGLTSSAICGLQLKSAQQDAEDAAETICMLVPRLLEPDNGLSSIISSAILLRFASAFYRKYEFEEKLDWCETITGAVQRRFGISLKSSNA